MRRKMEMKNKEKTSKNSITHQKSGVKCKNLRKKGKLKLVFGKIGAVISKAVYPDDCNCIVCEKEIPKGSKYCLCEQCLKTFPFNNGRICVKCGSPVGNEANYCIDCQNNTKHFDFVRSSLVYEKEAQRIVLDMKFNNNRWIEKHFAEMLFDTYNQNHLDAEIVIPVPLSYKREKQRGYNQALLLAKSLAEKLKLPLADDVVLKVVDNKQQSSLSARERRENVKGVYNLQNASIVKGKKVLLVDDILTTGSTLSEISRLLKKAGASAVYGLVVASPHYKVPAEQNEDLTDFEIIS